ncbi:MAG: ABC transporter permease [Xanthomonadales bacterium]|nr:ABC transporter permease [Xanthomonadales bacterium]
MLRLTIRRLLALVPLLFVVSLVVFSLLLMVPGDPAISLAGEDATVEQIEETRDRLGLDDPVLVQYGRWASDAVTGDLGTSLYSSQSVTSSLWSRLPVTLSLTFAAVVVGLVISIPAGLLSASRPDGWIDRASRVGSSLGIAIPNFWLAAILLIVFAINTDLFPAVGYVPFTENPVEWARHLVLPAIALGAIAAAEMTRQLRGAMMDVLRSDYVRTARANGIRRHVILVKHALKNAAIPVVTVLGLQVAYLLGGSVIIEQMFALPGVGRLAINAVIARDLPMIQGVVLFVVLVSVLVNLAVDLSYGFLNPKVRAE